MNPFCVRLSSQGTRAYTFSYFYHEEYAADAQRILARSHESTPGAWCDCSGLALPVSIHRRDFSGGARYHLARFPGTGHQHEASCPFFGDDAPEVIRKTRPIDDGRIKLSVPLSFRTGISAPVESREGNHAPAAKTASAPTMSLGKFAWHLFRKAGLHQCWSSKLVRYYQASHRLAEAAEDMVLQGESADKALFIPQGYAEAEKGSDTNDRALALKMGEWREDMRLGLILGQISGEDHIPNRFAVLHVEALHAPIYCDLEKLDQMQRTEGSWPEDGILDAERYNRWLAATVRVTAKNNLSLREGRILRTTAGYVPVDNRHQAAEAHRVFFQDKQAFERLPENEITRAAAFRSLGPLAP